MIDAAGRWPVDGDETRAANRAWWDGEADDYYAEHGAFLGDSEFVWGPEGWTEAELDLLGVRDGMTVLEIGAGAAQCSRWLARHHDVRVVASDLSMGMLRTARRIEASAGGAGIASPSSSATAWRCPWPTRASTACSRPTASCRSSRTAARCSRRRRGCCGPGGRFVFSTSHPVRWAFPDDPGPHGLTATTSYFDRTPYVESEAGVVTYAEHHRTLGDLVRQVVAAGLVLVDLVEPEWPARNEQAWGGWSPLRGRLLPGTAILVADRPR